MEAFDWMAHKILKGVQTRRPSLDIFDEKILHLFKVRDQIAEMSHSVNIGWLRVNSSPLIKEL